MAKPAEMPIEPMLVSHQEEGCGPRRNGEAFFIGDQDER